MNLPGNNEASATARLENARRRQWHQHGEALLTIENARSFLNAAGLVLFAPRPQIAAPAPSFVEAVLGETNAAPTVEQTAPARELLVRLVGEGLAVPLNLLGVGSVVGQPSDAPDFIVSAQVFSYVFTLRGDKGWKQPPQPAGTAKFSNLAIAAHEALTRRGPLSAYDLATELGKEVTEGAVLRSLGELWMHLRVLPLPQMDGRATVWELASTRLIKQMKAGANAGLPTALSALISLYLGQAIVASEDEVESFLSPLAARSRVRDVVHALVAARELDTVAVEGKTVLHVAGTALEFLTEETPTAPDVTEDAGAQGDSVPRETASPDLSEGEEHGEVQEEPGSRIAKFVPKRKPVERELAKAKPAKFARKPFSPRSDDARPKFAGRERGGAGPERERRPFVKREGSDSRPPRKAFERDGDRPVPRKPFDRSAGDRPPRKFSGRSGDDRPARKPFERGGDRPAARKPFERSSDGRPQRKPFDRSAGERPPRKFAERSSDSRPPRKPFSRGGDRPMARKPFDKAERSDRKRDFTSSEDRPRREFKPRSFEGRKPFGVAKSFDRTKPFARRSESGAGEEAKGRSGGFGGKRPFAKTGGFGKKTDGPSRGFRGRERDSDRGEGGTRSGASFGGKKFGSDRPRGAASGGPGGRFGGNKFGARPAGAKFGGKPGGGKFGPKKFGAKKPFGKPAGPRGPRPARPRGDDEA